MSGRWDEIRRLRRQRPRSPFLRVTVGVLVASSVWVWLSGMIEVGEAFSARRRANLVRFLSQDALPEPLREGEGWAGLRSWLGELWVSEAWPATLATLEIAVTAIVLAFLFGLLVAPGAARTLATQDPYPAGEVRPRMGRWRLVSGSARASCVVMRALPEYVLAFLLVALVSQRAWAAVLALAIHNGGILGRLFGDTTENVEQAPLRALRMSGTARRSLYMFGALPLALPRMISYFFYRFETCVREATVLGFVGIASLGASISEARVGRYAYDEMLLFIACGAGIVLVADLLSHLARGWVRRAGLRS